MSNVLVMWPGLICFTALPQKPGESALIKQCHVNGWELDNDIPALFRNKSAVTGYTKSTLDTFSPGSLVTDINLV